MKNKGLLFITLILANIVCSESVCAQKKGIVVDGSHNQKHAILEDFGKANATGIREDFTEFWYIVEDVTAQEWTATLTYQRMKSGEVDFSTATPPETAYNYVWGGWPGIKHNGQVFYTSKFLSTATEDYDVFHSALSILTNTVITYNGVMHKANVSKIGDYAFSNSNIRCIDVILWSDDNDNEPDKDLEFGNYVFYNCKNFIGLPEGSPYKVIPNNVTKIGRGVFKGCSAMERMIIGDKVAVIPEETFDGCTALKELKLGSGVKEIRCSITGLKRLAVSAPVPPAVASGCTVEAEEIWVPEEYLDAYKTAWAGKNIKPYSFKFKNNPVVAYAGYQGEVYFDRVSPGEGENNYVYCYPRDKKSDGSQNIIWTVDGTHGSNTPSGKFKTVWYSYDCDQRKMLAAGNVVYENRTLVRFDSPGTYKLYFTTLDITNHTEEVTVEVEALPAGYVPVEKITVSDAGALLNHTLKVGGTEKLRATIGTVDGTTATFDKVTWESSNPEVATINQTGDKILEVTGVKPGETVITARSTDPRMPDVYGTYTLRVVQLMESFILEANYGGVWDEIDKVGNYTIDGIVGETLQIRPVCFPEGTSHTAMYINVDPADYPGYQRPELEIDVEAGTIKLNSAGKAQLNVGVRDQTAYQETRVIITVSEPGGKINMIWVKEIESGKLYDYSNGYTGDVSDQVPIRLSYNGDAERKQVVWESSDPTVAEVVPTNQIATLAEGNEPQYHFTILCKKPGTVQLSAAAADGGTGYASFPVTVNQPKVVSVPVKQKAKYEYESNRYQLKQYEQNFFFELHKDGTASLVHPSAGSASPLTSDGVPAEPYNFEYPGDLFLSSGGWILWSPVMDSLQYKNRDMYFTALAIPDEIEYEGDKYTVTSIGDYAFAGSNVVCVNVPPTVTSIGNYAFKDAKKYKGFSQVTHYQLMPESVTELGKGIFSGCSALECMHIGHNVRVLPEETFDGCTKLGSISFGKNLERIDCNINIQPAGLDMVVFNSMTPPEFSEGCELSMSKSDYIIYVDPSASEAYKNAFPQFKISPAALTINSVSRNKVYIGDPIMVKYSPFRTSKCEYIEFYPRGAEGGFSNSGYQYSYSNDWLTWSFDDLSVVDDATEIHYTGHYMYLSFAKEGTHKVYFNVMGLPDLQPTEVEFEVLPGTPVSKVELTTAPPQYLDVDSPLRLNVKVSPETASNKAVAWEVSDTTIARINEKNELIGLKPGVVKLRALSADPIGATRRSDEYTVNVVRAVREINIYNNGVKVPGSGISGYQGDILKLTAVMNPEDGEYTTSSWATSSASIAKVKGEDKEGIIELMGTGRGIITFSLGQKAGETEMRKEIPVQVKIPVKEIVVKVNGLVSTPQTPIIGEIGSVYTITAAVNADATDKNVTWAVSDPKILEYTQNGNEIKVTLKSTGVAQLTITSTDGKGRNVVLSFGVKESGAPDPVVPVDVKVNRIEILKQPLKGYVGDRLALEVKVYPENATNKEIKWESTDPFIASVTNAGEIIMQKEGDVEIIGKAMDGSGVSVSCAVKVEKRPEKPQEIKVQQITLDSNMHSGYPGDRIILIVVVLPENATNPKIIWKSNNEGVASVTNAGVITLLGEGAALITGTAADGSGVSVSCSVNVNAQPSAIDGIESDKKGVSIEESALIVRGLNEGDTVSLYNMSGALVGTKKCSDESVTFSLRNHGIYIVVTPAGSFKVRY